MTKPIYAVRAYDAKGKLLLETTHATEASKATEVAAWRERMKHRGVGHIQVTRLESPYDTEWIYPMGGLRTT